MSVASLYRPKDSREREVAGLDNVLTVKWHVLWDRHGRAHCSSLRIRIERAFVFVS